MFEGRFESFKACLEQAVKDWVALNCVDLRNKNLTNANLDDAILPGAALNGSNLTGANISEAYLKSADFSGSVLYNACFNDSNLTACNFADASFGATDIHGSIISRAQFSTLSCFHLDFTATRQMNGCIFINPDGCISEMSKPPLVIMGLSAQPIIFMDHHVKTGHNVIDQKRLEPLMEKLSSKALRNRLLA